jgi:hypothetical protein
MKSALKWAEAMLFATIIVGCAAAEGDEAAVSTSENALIGRDTYLYFRSNVTGWDANASTRLRQAPDPYQFSLLYNVANPGAVDSIFTETNARDGWGTQQSTYGSKDGDVTVPGGGMLSSTVGGFRVNYPGTGRYKVTADARIGTFSVTKASTAESWQPCLNNAVTTIAQSPNSPDITLVGCNNGDLYLSTNGRSTSANWLKVDSGKTPGGTSFDLPGLAVNSIAYSPVDIKTAYVSFAGTQQGHKLWKTVTGGATWVELTNPIGEVWSISVNPRAPQTVYVMGPAGVSMSTDGGTTWTANVTPGPLTVPIASGSKLSTVTVAPENPNVIWVGATNGDIFYTDNATTTQTWKNVSHGLPTRTVTHLAINVKDGDTTVYATFDGMYNDSLWVTSNEGFGWANLHDEPGSGLPTTNMPLPGIYAFYGLSVNPVDNTVVYIDGTYGAGVSTNAGINWLWRVD